MFEVIDGIEYFCEWSSKMAAKEIGDFIYVQNEVFDTHIGYSYFKHKFIDNIYGDSLIVIAYINGAPAAARAMWRNDLDTGRRQAYQPCDTAVLYKYRGCGIFKVMTTLAKSRLPHKSILYNFPNKNSYPGYKKLGWRDIGSYCYRIWFGFRQYEKEHPFLIDSEYVKWWFGSRKDRDFCVVSRKGQHYLMRRRKYNIYIAIGKICESDAVMFRKTRFPIILFYSQKKSFFHRFSSLIRVVASGDAPIDIKIPLYKIDAI
ncbi:MAG: hypothetical protein N3I35_05835 [Clostridia bacterium]|nr:hypothetical protein [Clostridia bacterium]